MSRRSGKTSVSCWTSIVAGAVLAGCPSSCRTSPDPRPAWIDQPKSADSLYLYQVGHATGAASPEAARAAAYQDALARIASAILSSVPIQGGQAPLASSLPIRDAEIMPGCVHAVSSGKRHDCWVQVSYPLAEKNKIVARLDAGEKLNARWRAARANVHRGASEPAVQALLAIVADYENALGQEFAVEEAKLLLGDVYAQRKDLDQARRWYGEVSRLSPDRPWRDQAAARLDKLPRAPRMRPLADRFAGKTIALLPCVREGAACRRSPELFDVLEKDCREAGIPCVDLSPKVPAAAMAAAFDQGQFEEVHREAAARQAGIVLAVLLDIDPAKRGQKTKVFGLEAPALDTTVRFRVTDGRQTVYSGQFQETAGAAPADRLAAHATGILIQNYLVAQCPRVP